MNLDALVDRDNLAWRDWSYWGHTRFGMPERHYLLAEVGNAPPEWPTSVGCRDRRERGASLTRG